MFVRAMVQTTNPAYFHFDHRAGVRTTKKTRQYHLRTTLPLKSCALLFPAAVRPRDPALGQPSGLLQLVHPLPAELLAQRVADAGRFAEPHQLGPSQGRAPPPVQRRRSRLPAAALIVQGRWIILFLLLAQLPPHQGVRDRRRPTSGLVDQDGEGGGAGFQKPCRCHLLDN